MALPDLKITVYSDYICPFCYVGHHRLQRLRDSYYLKINWCFLEIHPEVSAGGETIDSLNYPSATWQKMMINLERIAKEENIPLSKLRFISNSKDALLLSESAKELGRDIFYALHEKLFTSYFVDGNFILAAWQKKKYQQRLLENFNSARQHNIQSVPSFVFENKVLTGVVSESAFREAAKKAVNNE